MKKDGVYTRRRVWKDVPALDTPAAAGVRESEFAEFIQSKALLMRSAKTGRRAPTLKRHWTADFSGLPLASENGAPGMERKPDILAIKDNVVNKGLFSKIFDSNGGT